ncbi:hypothetical protein GCM10020000_76680 [Streptomyces olivoverticillatus]
MGGETATRSLDVLRPGGQLVTIALTSLPADLPEKAAARGVKLHPLLVEADQQGMGAIRDLVAAGRLRAVIEATFPPRRGREGP